MKTIEVLEKTIHVRGHTFGPKFCLLTMIFNQKGTLIENKVMTKCILVEYLIVFRYHIFRIKRYKFERFFDSFRRLLIFFRELKVHITNLDLIMNFTHLCSMANKPGVFPSEFFALQSAPNKINAFTSVISPL